MPPPPPSPEPLHEAAEQLDEDKRPTLRESPAAKRRDVCGVLLTDEQYELERKRGKLP